MPAPMVAPTPRATRSKAESERGSCAVLVALGGGRQDVGDGFARGEAVAHRIPDLPHARSSLWMRRPWHEGESGASPEPAPARGPGPARAPSGNLSVLSGSGPSGRSLSQHQESGRSLTPTCSPEQGGPLPDTVGMWPDRQPNGLRHISISAGRCAPDAEPSQTRANHVDRDPAPRAPAIRERQLRRHLPGGLGGDGGGQPGFGAGLRRGSLDEAGGGRVPDPVRDRCGGGVLRLQRHGRQRAGAGLPLPVLPQRHLLGLRPCGDRRVRRARVLLQRLEAPGGGEPRRQAHPGPDPERRHRPLGHPLSEASRRHDHPAHRDRASSTASPRSARSPKPAGIWACASTWTGRASPMPAPASAARPPT